MIRELQTSRSRSDTSAAVSDNGDVYRTSFIDGEENITTDISNELYQRTYIPMTRTSDDNVTASFQRRKNAGEIIMNDCRMTKVVEYGPMGQISAESEDPNNPGYPYRRYTGNIAYRHLFSFSTADMQGLASEFSDRDHIHHARISQSRAWANIDSSSYQFGESILEVGETIGSARVWLGALVYTLQVLRNKQKRINAFVALSGGIDKLMKDPTRARIYRKWMAKYWMEARFAVRPLLYEAKSIIALVEKGLDSSNRTRVLGRSVLRTDPQTSVSTKQHKTLGGLGSFEVTNQVEQRLVATTGVIIAKQLKAPSSFHATMEELGLKGDQLTLMFQTTRLSWLLDYFGNFTDWIDSWELSMETKVLGSWTTVETHRLESSNVTDWVTNPELKPWRSDPAVSGVRHERVLSDRIRYADLGRPILPRIDINLNAWKLGDLLAVAYRLLSRVRQF